MYATTNNGAGCVETDDGTMWFSRSCRGVDQLEGKWWYKMAKQLHVDAIKPYAIKGSGKKFEIDRKVAAEFSLSYTARCPGPISK